MNKNTSDSTSLEILSSTLPANGSHWERMSETLLADYLQSHQEALIAIKSQVTEPLQRVEALSKLSTAMDRTFRALDRGTPEHPPLTIARMVLERQSEFIKNSFPNHLPAFLEILKPFEQALLADSSWQTGTFKK